MTNKTVTLDYDEYIKLQNSDILRKEEIEKITKEYNDTIEHLAKSKYFILSDVSDAWCHLHNKNNTYFSTKWKTYRLISPKDPGGITAEILNTISQNNELFNDIRRENEHLQREIEKIGNTCIKEINKFNKFKNSPWYKRMFNLIDYGK